MKNLFTSIALALSLTTSIAVSAEQAYNIATSTTSSAAKIPSSCTNCTIHISDNAVLTFDQDEYFQNSTISGGSVVVNGKKLVFYSASTFDNVDVSLINSANMINSGALTIKNSAFTFSGSSWATVYTSISMTNSSWSFLDNAWMEATGGTFKLASSSLLAGDGTMVSKAYIKFNGGILNISDATSFLSVGNNNNYYFNWSAYSVIRGSITTTNNKLNCDANGKNACSAPIVYGPATLNVTGVSSTATLPVILSAFSVKYASGRVGLSWTTEQEKNAGHFEIERSNDGKTWSAIGNVTAKSNSAIATNYSFIDANPSTGTVSYRLKIVDIDEAFEYSPIKAVKISEAGSVQMKIYPNPTADHVVVSSSDNNGTLRIQLMSLSGQVLKQVNATGGQTTLGVSEFHSGSYLVRITDNAGNAQIFKLLVTK